MASAVFFFFFFPRAVSAKEIFTLGNLKLWMFKNKLDTSIFAALCRDFHLHKRDACAFCLHCSLQVLTSESSGDTKIAERRNCGHFASSTQGQNMHEVMKELNCSATMSYSHSKQD